MPHLSEVYRKYHSKGFQLVSISLDDTREPVQRFVADHKMNWRQIHDAGGKLARQYKVRGIPFTVLVGRDGVIWAVDAEGNDLDRAVIAALKAGKQQ